ncbi:hypothetical protein [Streptomyces sp. NPDC096033]|uniref:hypothetical protein n=1 Tax=Streptomyces sp. NPDC096033 TaxID=3366071 RepID=UPI0038306458
MSRTAHHTPDKQTPYGKQRRADRKGLPWWQWTANVPERRVDLADLRYSAAELRTAEKEGRRPRPQNVRRAFEVYQYCCAWRDSGLKGTANLQERAARARLRVAARKALLDPETAIEPYRTRHQAHWDSW